MGCSSGLTRVGDMEERMRETHTHAWVGIDAGKGHHCAAVLDEAGLILWSHKINIDETAILHALSEILALAD